MKSNKRTTMYTTVVIMILTLITIGAVPPVARADSPLSASLRVYPVKIETPVMQGKESTSTVNIENMANFPTDIRVYSQDFTMDEKGNYKFLDQKLPYSVSTASWMSCSESTFTVMPHEIKKVTVKLTAPKHVEPGGHYAIVFFEATPNITDSNRPKGAFMLMKTRVGALILGSAVGKVRHDEKLKSFSIPKYNYNSEIPVDIVFQNKGNIHASLNGAIVFTDSSGKRLGRIPVINRTSFPSRELTISDKWIPVTKMGRVTATVKLESLDGHKWEESKTFFVIPLKQIAVGLAVIIVIAIIGFIFRKKFSFNFKIERRQENASETPLNNSGEESSESIENTERQKVPD